MTITEFWERKIPDYYPTMYMDGFSPTDVLAAAHKSIL